MKIIGVKELDANDYLAITVSKNRIIVGDGTVSSRISVGEAFSNSLRGCSSTEVIDKVVDYYLDNTRIWGIRNGVYDRGRKYSVIEGPLRDKTNMKGVPKYLRTEIPLGRKSSVRIVDKYLFDREDIFLNSLGTGCNYKFLVDNDSYYRYFLKDNTMYFFLRRKDNLLSFDEEITDYEDDFFRKAIYTILDREEHVTCTFNSDNTLSYTFKNAGYSINIPKELCRVSNGVMVDISRERFCTSQNKEKQLKISGF